MPHDNLDRVTALAGIYQAVNGVHQIARQGATETASMEPSIYSLFQVNAENVKAVFGEPGAVAEGMRCLIASLTGVPERNLDIIRYAISLMRLERSLSEQPALLSRISSGIEVATAKRDHFGLLHPTVLAHFADLYSETLSHLEPRIIVRGDAVHLRNPDYQNQIRALLLAGVRAAMLWRQVGGSRWQILFQNKRILNAARNYLSD